MVLFPSVMVNTCLPAVSGSSGSLHRLLLLLLLLLHVSRDLTSQDKAVAEAELAIYYAEGPAKTLSVTAAQTVHIFCCCTCCCCCCSGT
jgi:hypothetical protein